MSVRFGRENLSLQSNSFIITAPFRVEATLMQARLPALPAETQQYYWSSKFMQNNAPKRWYSRGYLPHFDGGQTIQFLTYRLPDSMPQNVLENWRVELEKGEITDADFHRRIEIYLDQGYGNCYLKRFDVAEIVEENLLRFDGVKYKLYAWVIMPNHIHLVLKPLEGFTLGEIVHSCKSFTANRANKLLGRSGMFWFPEPFDRFIRDQNHFENTVSYIENNPVKAKLCREKSDWRFSSAFCRNAASEDKVVG